MKRFTLVSILALGLLGLAPTSAQVGTAAVNPIRFNDIRYWLDDARPSLQLLERTLRTDMLASRVNLKWTEQPRWVKLQNQPAFQASVFHFTYQGIFWAPIFSAIVWTPPALLTDLLFAMTSDSWEFLFTASVWSTVLGATELQQENTFADLIKLNIVYVTDALDLFDSSGTPLPGEEKASLSRTYAGLAIKVLDTNYLFAGYSFVDMPYLEGWADYVAEIGAQQKQQVFVFGNKGFSTGELFFYNNFTDLFSVSALVDWGAEALVKFLGLGLYLNFFEVIRPDLYFTYIQALSRFSLDTQGDLKLADWFFVHWKWYLPLDIWQPFNDLRVGATLLLANSEGSFGFGLRGDYITYVKEDAQKHGFYAEVGFYFPVSIRLVGGASRNASDILKRLPFAEDDIVYHVRLEVGMDNNFDGRFQLRKKDLMGYMREDQ